MDARQRKIVIMAAVVLVGIVFGILLFRYLTTGIVTVKTAGSGYYVRVVKTSSGENKEIGEAQSIDRSLKLRLKSGEYQVYVYGQSVSANSNVTVRARQHQTITLTPRKTLPTEAVYGYGVSDLVADSPQFIFISKSSGRLMSTEPDGNVHTIDEGRAYLSVQWASPGVGVAQATDKSLFSVRGSSVTKLSLPFDTTGEEGVYYAVAPDKTVYVSRGNEVYQGLEGANFKKIYSGSYSHLKLAASDNRVAVFYGGSEGEEGMIRGGITPQLSIINNDGKLIKTLKGSEFFSGKWSPNGKYLLLSGPTGIKLFDGSLREIVSIPTADLGSFAWKNDSSGFFYGSGSELWDYNIQTSDASKIATMPNGIIDGVYLDSNQADVYASVLKNDSDSEEGSLLRVKLNGKSSGGLGALSIFLPEKVGVCYLNYVNFTRPVIAISYPSSTTTADFCINAAKGELRYYDINPGQFTYTTNPSSDE